MPVDATRVFANIIWPALVQYQRERCWWVIGATVIIEWWILRRTLRISALGALAVTLAANVFSAIVGSLTGGFLTDPIFGEYKPALLPLSGLYWEVYVNTPLAMGTFNTLTWVAAIVCATVINTALEGLVFVTIVRKTAQKSIVFWLPMANLATAELTFLSLWVVPGW